MSTLGSGTLGSGTLGNPIESVSASFDVSLPLTVSSAFVAIGFNQFSVPINLAITGAFLGFGTETTQLTIPISLTFTPDFELFFEQGPSGNPTGAIVNLSDLLVVDFVGRSFVREKKTLRALAYQMLPQFVFDAYPTFVEFTETFLDFVEKRYTQDGVPSPGPYHILKNLLETADIDETELEFVKFLKIKLGRDLPASTAYDLRTFLKHIKSFYLSKGTKNSLQFFFRSVFNTYSKIYLPKIDLVRASSHTWYVPYVTQLRTLHVPLVDVGGHLLDSSELAELFDAEMYGQTSKQTAWLGGILDGDSIEILAHSGEFLAGETVTITKTDGSIITLWIPLDGIQFLPGSFLTEDGMPSSNKRLQDSYYWQEFSYEVISPNQISDIVNPLVMNVHPAGFKIFARVTEENPSVLNPDNDEEIEIIRHLIIHIDRMFEEEEEIDMIQFPLNFSALRFVQSYVDVGEFFKNEEEIAFSQVYENVFKFDSHILSSLERGEPQFNLFVSFGGYKLPCGNDTIPGYADEEAMVYSYADQIASIGFGGFSIETMEQLTIAEAGRSYCRNLARRSVRSEIFTIDDSILLESPYEPFSFNLYGTAELEEGWSNSGTRGKVALVFYNGKLVKPLTATLTTEIVEGIRVAKLAYFGPYITKKPLFEVVYLSERDMGGSNDGDNRTSITLSAGQTEVEWSELPPDSEPLLVFLNGKNLIPYVDFKVILSDNSSFLELRKEITANSTLDIFILRSETSVSTSLVPMVGPDEEYKLLRPVDAPLEVIPSRLATALADCLVWWSFEESSMNFANELLLPSWGTGELECYSPISLFNEDGPFNNTKTKVFDGTPNQTSWMAAWDLESFIPATDDPFTVNVWAKFNNETGDQVIYAIGQTQTLDPLLDDCSIHLKVVKVSDDFKFVARSSDGTTLTALETSLGSVVPGEWYMITTRFNGVDTLNLDVRSEAGKIILSTAMTGVSRPNVENVATIGEDGVSNFHGQIAHFALWNTYLRDHELDALYNNGLGLDKPVYFI